MRKIISAIMIIVLAAVLLGGCARKSVDIPQLPSGTQNSAPGVNGASAPAAGDIPDMITGGISDVDNISSDLDTTDIDSDMGSLGQALNNW